MTQHQVSLAAMFGPRKPYDHREEAASTTTVEMFSETRTFRAGDYGKHYQNQTFREDRHARMDLDGMAARIADVKDAAERLRQRVPAAADALATAFDEWAQKHISESLAHIASNSGMASAMVTGPSNFPVARQQKLMDRHQRRYERLREHCAKARKRLERIAFPHGDPSIAIRSDNPDAVALIEDKIAKLEARSASMKAANKTVRSWKKTGQDEAALVEALKTEHGYGEAGARAIAKPNYMGQRGFEGFELSNTRAEINRLQARRDQLQANAARAEQGDTETTHQTSEGEVTLCENVEAHRVQLIFPGKPSAETRSLLKSHGFRWSPSFGAWQRHLNHAGRERARFVLKSLA